MSALLVGKDCTHVTLQQTRNIKIYFITKQRRKNDSVHKSVSHFSCYPYTHCAVYPYCEPLTSLIQAPKAREHKTLPLNHKSFIQLSTHIICNIMKHIHLRAMIFTIILTFCLYVPATAQTKNPRQAATEGDTVWVVVNYVKPDKKAQFEKFVHEILWPPHSKLSETEQRMFRQTRVLHGAAPQEDGSYTYIFMMDPVISGANYSIEDMLRKMYPEDKAAEYFKLYEESLARDYHMYTLVQSRH
jgi:hypothetical protein